MERWRWLPDDLGRDHVMVNIAGFELSHVRDGALVEKMAVVVGKPYSRTPVFSDAIRYAEFNCTGTAGGHRGQGGAAEAQDQPGGAVGGGLRGGAATRSIRSRHRLAALRSGQLPVPDPPAAGAGERAWPGQVHVPEQVRRVPARHAVAEPVQPDRPGLQPRLHPPVAADRLAVDISEHAPAGTGPGSSGRSPRSSGPSSISRRRCRSTSPISRRGWTRACPSSAPISTSTTPLHRRPEGPGDELVERRRAVASGGGGLQRFLGDRAVVGERTDGLQPFFCSAPIGLHRLGRGPSGRRPHA